MQLVSLGVARTDDGYTNSQLFDEGQTGTAHENGFLVKLEDHEN